MNEAYKALKQLQNTINTIDELEKEHAALTNKKAKIAATTVDYKHTHFPFAKAVNELETKAKSKSLGTAIIRTLITVLFSAFIAGIITGIYYILYTQDIIPGFIIDYHTYILIGLPIIAIIGIYSLSHTTIKHGLIERRKKHIINKHKDRLKEAKEKSIEEADRYQQQLNARVKTINEELKTTETNIKGHKHKLEKNQPLPNKYLPALDTIITYFEDKRADTLKEAINLYVKETQDELRYTRLLYAIKDDTIPIDALLDENADLETYKTLHIQDPKTPPKEEDPSTAVDDADTVLKDTHGDTETKQKQKDTPPEDPPEPPATSSDKKPRKKHEDLKVYTKE